jgi:hypothetical protein
MAARTVEVGYRRDSLAGPSRASVTGMSVNRLIAAPCPMEGSDIVVSRRRGDVGGNELLDLAAVGWYRNAIAEAHGLIESRR